MASGSAEPGARIAAARGIRPRWGWVQGGGHPSRHVGPGVEPPENFWKSTLL